ncbi:hypothetical protein HKX48_004650 [Thoreauomyces humboldtii]|nr:hypothetical protein HKX48_004650 [Thoreauomyces humboldtii]
MSSYDDLKDALRESLETRGTLTDVRAHIRAEVFRALHDPDERPPPPPRETALMNELVREYLRYMGYRHSLSVFASESDLPRTPMPRAALADELNVSVEQRSYPPVLPLLYGLALKSQFGEAPIPEPGKQKIEAAVVANSPRKAKPFGKKAPVGRKPPPPVPTSTYETTDRDSAKESS